MSREARQRKILEIISSHDIDTQEELVSRLAAEGFAVTQATVSRDIRDMSLVKTLAADGRKYRYQAQPPKDSKSERFISVFRNTVLSIRAAENLVVIKTETGSANAADILLPTLLATLLSTLIGAGLVALTGRKCRT